MMSEYDSSFLSLLSHVRVEFCSNHSIELMNKFSVEHGFESITSDVFEPALLHRSSIPHKLSLSSCTYFSRETNPRFIISNIEELHIPETTSDNKRQLALLRKTKEDYKEIYSVLEKASREGDHSTIKFAVEEKYSDVRDWNGCNMILNAAFENNLCLVKSLLIHGADIMSRDNNRTIFHLFFYIGNLEGG